MRTLFYFKIKKVEACKIKRQDMFLQVDFFLQTAVTEDLPINVSLNKSLIISSTDHKKEKKVFFAWTQEATMLVMSDAVHSGYYRSSVACIHDTHKTNDIQTHTTRSMCDSNTITNNKPLIN